MMRYLFIFTWIITGSLLAAREGVEIDAGEDPCDVHDAVVVRKLINDCIIPALKSRFEVDLQSVAIPEGVGFDKSILICNEDLGSPRDCCSIGGWTIFFGYESIHASSGFKMLESTPFDLTGVQRIIRTDRATILAAFRIDNHQADVRLVNGDSGAEVRYHYAASSGQYEIRSDASRLMEGGASKAQDRD